MGAEGKRRGRREGTEQERGDTKANKWVGVGRRGGAGAQGGRGTDSVVEGEFTMLPPSLVPPSRKYSPQESRKHWFKGTKGFNSQMRTRPGGCRHNWLYTQPLGLIL